MVDIVARHLDVPEHLGKLEVPGVGVIYVRDFDTLAVAEKIFEKLRAHVHANATLEDHARHRATSKQDEAD